MRNNYTKPVFVTTSRWLIPVKYFNEKRYVIERFVYDEEEEYVVYLK